MREEGYAAFALAAVEGRTSEERARSIVEQLLTQLDVDVAAFVDLTRCDGHWYYDHPVCVGSSRVVAHWRKRIPGSQCVSIWDPCMPPQRDVNRFQPGADVDARVLEGTPVYDLHYLPFGLCRERRMLVYDGARFAGWIGVSRHLDRPGFTRGEQRRLNSLAPKLVAMVSAIRSPEDDLPNGNAKILLRPDGSIEFACRRARHWVTPARRALVRSRVRAAAGRSCESGEFPIDGAAARFVRMQGNGSTRYLCILSPGVTPQLAPHRLERPLTPAEHAVASMAAHGLTVREIAEDRRTTPNTIKFHLKNAYDKLGVSTRLELARAMSVP